jgi:hypothetical protein
MEFLIVESKLTFEESYGLIEFDLTYPKINFTLQNPSVIVVIDDSGIEFSILKAATVYQILAPKITFERGCI